MAPPGHTYFHARGLAAVYRGRFAEARDALETSIRLGTELGDSLFMLFDRLFHAEALLFLGLYAEAGRELADLSKDEMPGRIRKMALSRKAFLIAMTGGKEAMPGARDEHRLVNVERPVPFLDAWDDLYLGWALSIRAAADPGSFDGALRHLKSAQDFFSQKGLRPALALTRWIEAEGHFFQGNPERSLQILRGETEGGNDLTRILRSWRRSRISPGPGT